MQEPLTPPVFHILLALADEDRHGYGIMQDVERQTEGGLQMGPGTLYGCIKRMLASGLIEEADERPDPEIDVDAILGDRHAILPCAALLKGEYGQDGLFFQVNSLTYNPLLHIKGLTFVTFGPGISIRMSCTSRPPWTSASAMSFSGFSAGTCASRCGAATPTPPAPSPIWSPAILPAWSSAPIARCCWRRWGCRASGSR